MPYPELFAWWAITISWSSVFLTMVSIYLYRTSRKKREEKNRKTPNVIRFGKDFIFVWVLLSLLILYIVSIDRGSPTLFAAGNILVEAILIAYILSSRTRKSEQIPDQQSR